MQETLKAASNYYVTDEGYTVIFQVVHKRNENGQALDSSSLRVCGAQFAVSASSPTGMPVSKSKCEVGLLASSLRMRLTMGKICQNVFISMMS